VRIHKDTHLFAQRLNLLAICKIHFLFLIHKEYRQCIDRTVIRLGR
jgi:hypothetical protein